MSDSLEVRVTALENEVKEIKSTCKDISERLIRMEETLKNNKYNTVDFKTYNKAFTELYNSVKTLTDRVSEVLVKLDKQHERIEKLEDADGDRAKKILTWLATTVGALVIGAIFGMIVRGGV